MSAIGSTVVRTVASPRHDPWIPSLSGQVEELLSAAERIAVARGHGVVGTEHLLLAMTRQTTDSFARRLLDQVGATEQLRADIEAVIGSD